MANTTGRACGTWPRWWFGLIVGAVVGTAAQYRTNKNVSTSGDRT